MTALHKIRQKLRAGSNIPAPAICWLGTFFGEFLEQHFQMVYLDQRGVGRSTSPADKNFTMNRMVKDFEEVRNTLGFKNWLILGHSFGGLLQMGYVIKFPDAVKGMLFINCKLFMEDSYKNSWLPKAAFQRNILSKYAALRRRHRPYAFPGRPG